MDTIRTAGMNRYGAQAQRHWQAYAPNRYAALEDPEEFFAQMGERVQARIEAVRTQLEAAEPAQTEYTARVAQLTGFQRTAEEIVLPEEVLIPEETTDEDDFQEWLAETSGAEPIVEWATENQLAAEEGRRPEGLTVADMADEWGIPEDYFLNLVASENPYRIIYQDEDGLIDGALRRFWEKLGRPAQDL